ncbi:MAG: ankyrin-like [Rickettsiaceae bacterium]|jgi:ankyrin repeat protein|nr:ankyrin-like [Rickettsiaceae bacterium]
MKDSKREIEEVIDNQVSPFVKKQKQDHKISEQELIVLLKEAIDRDDIELLSNLLQKDQLESLRIAINVRIFNDGICEFEEEIQTLNILQYASYTGAINTISYLVDDQKMDIRLLDKENGRTLLHWLGDKNAESIVQYCLMKGLNIDINDRHKAVTPLHEAAFHGSAQAVQALIKYGASLEEEDNTSETALHRAAFYGHVEIVDFLIKYGANIEAKNDAEETPIVRAAFTGRIKVVEALIRKGADLDAEKSEGWNALLTAASEQHVEIVKLLIENGAATLKDREYKHIEDPLIINMLKAQEYIDDILEREQAEAINLTPEMEGVVLAKIYNKFNKLYKSNELRAEELRSKLEQQIEKHPIVQKVIYKLDQVIEDNEYGPIKLIYADMEAARKFYNLSAPLTVEDIKDNLRYEDENSLKSFEKLLKAYDHHKAEHLVIEQLDSLKQSFRDYLLQKKSYLENHPEHDSYEVPSAMQPIVDELFNNLLDIESVNIDKEKHGISPSYEEAMLFYSLIPSSQITGSLAEITAESADSLWN